MSLADRDAVGVLTMLLTGAIVRNDTVRSTIKVHQADPPFGTAALARIDDRAKLWDRIGSKDLATTRHRYHEVLRAVAKRQGSA